jgi:hypothetical protein
MRTSRPAGDYSFRCAAGPSSSGWPHDHRVDWEDQMMVNAQKPTHAEQGLTDVVCTPFMAANRSISSSEIPSLDG